MTNQTRCYTCGKPLDKPYRRYDGRGNVIEGCVDKCHDAHADDWHNRDAAKRIRAADAARLAS